MTGNLERKGRQVKLTYLDWLYTKFDAAGPNIWSKEIRSSAEQQLAVLALHSSVADAHFLLSSGDAIVY